MNALHLNTTAIVTCHNYGRYLVRCLDSLFAQTVPFKEIIVVDDDSHDMTQAVCRQYYEGRVRYKRVKAHLQQGARNEGFVEASGDYIVFVDADDWLDPRFHEKMALPLLEDATVGFTYCGMQLCPEGPDLEWFKNEAPPMIDFDLARLWQGNYCSHTSMIRREAWYGLEKFFGCPLENGRAYGEDWDHWLYTVQRGWKAVLVPEKLLNYRIHAASNSRIVLETPGRVPQAKWEVQKKYLDYELTLLFFYNGHKPVETCIREIQALELPAGTQIIWASSSAALVPRKRLERFATSVHMLPWTDITDERRKIVLHGLQGQVRGRDVLLLSDLYTYPADFYQKLKSGRQAMRADIYSAFQMHPVLGRPQAWRAVRGDAYGKGVYAVPLTRKPKRVFAAGLDGTLMHAKAFHRMRFGPWLMTPQPPYAFAEYRAGFHAAQNNFRWFADGRIRAREATVGAAGTESWPAVSVVVPVKDDEKRLRRLLQSLALLDYPADKLEIVVVDNASRKPLKALEPFYPQVRFLHCSGRGSYAARNHGIRQSRHSLIAFTDADCVVTASWLKELVAGLQRFPWTGAAAGPNRPLHEKKFLSRLTRRIGDHGNFAGTPELPPYAITMNILYKREVFDAIGLFDDTQISGSDAEMTWRMHLDGRWKLEILPDQAWVVHEDAADPIRCVKRILRIGHGLYAAYQKYPAFTPDFLCWVPRHRWEMALHSVKKIIEWEVKKTRQKFKASRVEYYGLELRRFLLRLGFDKNRKETLSRYRAGGQPVFIYLGQESLHPSKAVYGRLKRLSDQGVRVVHVDPPKVSGRFFTEAASLLGLTHLWPWHPGLWSMEERTYSLFRHKAGLRSAKKEICRRLKIRKGETVYIGAEADSGRCKEWTEVWREDYTVVENEQPVFHRAGDVPVPAAGCILDEIDSQLDLESLAALAKLRLWPVVVSGRVHPEILPRLRQLVLQHDHLFVVPERDDSLIPQLIAGVYPFHSAQAMPESAQKMISNGLPVLTMGMHAGGAEVHGKPVDDRRDLILAFRALAFHPAWPRPETSTAEARSPLETAVTRTVV